MLNLIFVLTWLLLGSGSSSYLPLKLQDGVGFFGEGFALPEPLPLEPLPLELQLFAEGGAFPVAAPAPPPSEREATRPVGLAVVAALFCVFNLSTVALLGAFALKRYFDGMSPDP
ncbi:MAG: hypothetical protein EI684_22460 [Candidatus Viridilinea halotolerans]|uniref:Uncharacterized protein n=1 Tax=Candidatus Viridilinea halotolerans TaxID=2491704 RepID=A0A426TQR5_9CHLR|nr:MAG: hypothetical protein EI684_22460 [Candidatus Viridilinea halotolerans]